MNSGVLSPKQTQVLWLAVRGVRSVPRQAGLLKLPRDAVKNHMAAMCIRLNVQSVQEAVHVAVRHDDMILPVEDVTRALGESQTEQRRRRVNQWRRARESVLKYIADEYVYSRKLRLVSFDDLLRAFDHDITDMHRIVKRLERTCWIEIVLDDDRERYKPLAKP